MGPEVVDKPFVEIGSRILLLAGPGTGKTYQLEKRMQFLASEQENSPKAITVITYIHTTHNKNGV